MPDSRAKTISRATRKSNNPPKMRNDWMLIPIASSSAVPATANNTTINAEITVALMAMRFL